MNLLLLYCLNITSFWMIIKCHEVTLETKVALHNTWRTYEDYNIITGKSIDLGKGSLNNQCLIVGTLIPSEFDDNCQELRVKLIPDDQHFDMNTESDVDKLGTFYLPCSELIEDYSLLVFNITTNDIIIWKNITLEDPIGVTFLSPISKLSNLTEESSPYLLMILAACSFSLCSLCWDQLNIFNSSNEEE